MDVLTPVIDFMRKNAVAAKRSRKTIPETA